MEGGELVIDGNAGDYLGASYRGDWRGMKGGKIVIEGDAESRVGAQMTKGEIIVLGKIGYWLPGFIYKKDDQIEYDGKQYAVKVYQGDLGEGGKGKLYYAEA
jgi:formylmethanofuran dehydrogenase subunit C